MIARNKICRARNSYLISGIFLLYKWALLLFCPVSNITSHLMVFVSFFSIFVIIWIVIQPRTSIFNPPFLSFPLVWLFGNFSMEI